MLPLRATSSARADQAAIPRSDGPGEASSGQPSRCELHGCLVGETRTWISHELRHPKLQPLDPQPRSISTYARVSTFLALLAP